MGGYVGESGVVAGFSEMMLEVELEISIAVP